MGETSARIDFACNSHSSCDGYYTDEKKKIIDEPNVRVDGKKI